jgi:hypothetical protein
VQFQKIVKELAIINHGFAEIFGAGFSALLPLRNGACRTVVFDNAAVSNGDVSDALFEITDWIAARLHDLSYQPIGLDDSSSGIIDESRLIGVPRLCEAIALLRFERVNVQLLDALLSPQEFLFGATLATLFFEEPVVFRAELGTKMVGPPLAHHPPGDDRSGNNHRDNYNDCPTCHISSNLAKCSLGSTMARKGGRSRRTPRSAKSAQVKAINA